MHLWRNDLRGCEIQTNVNFQLGCQAEIVQGADGNFVTSCSCSILRLVLGQQETFFALLLSMVELKDCSQINWGL